jgi:hypothetical protein
MPRRELEKEQADNIQLVMLISKRKRMLPSSIPSWDVVRDGSLISLSFHLLISKTCLIEAEEYGKVFAKCLEAWLASPCLKISLPMTS